MPETHSNNKKVFKREKEKKEGEGGGRKKEMIHDTCCHQEVG